VAEEKLSHFDAIFSACRTARHRMRMGLSAGTVEVDGDKTQSRSQSSHHKRTDGFDLGTTLGEDVAALLATSAEGGIVRDWLGWIEASAADYALASRALGEVGIFLQREAAETRSLPGSSPVAAAADVIMRASGADPVHAVALQDVLRSMCATLSATRPLSHTASEGATAPFEAWARQIRRLAPLYTLRTGFARGLFTDERLQDNGRAVVGALLTRLQHPFEEGAWHMDRSDDVQGDSTRGDETLLERVGRGLSTRPHPSAANPLTSCGGQ